MKSTRPLFLMTASLLLLASTASAQDQVEAPGAVQSRTAVPGTLRGVLAATDRGPEALRRYILITRGIYGYRFEDFAPQEWDEPARP